MDPQRWARIESLYHAALEKGPGERAGYLAEACVDELELRREVESLLACAGKELNSPLAKGERWPSGFRLGSYEIIDALGVGGMGEVYRAKDTKLRREVAIKTLPREFQDDPDRLARFEREAQVLASLNHPGIASIYGVEERALIMELVSGPTLADRIARGRIPVEETQDIIRQLADALGYAHDRGVVHRDLKPANITLDPDGNVRILDFGLAAIVEQAATGDSDDRAGTSTGNADATALGTILGTPSYMAPEQARGKKVDKRADIWAFGVIAWEMLTGERLFQGKDTAEVLNGVLNQPIEFERIPGNIRKLLKRCLDRNPKDRLRDIGDFELLVDARPATISESPRRFSLGRLGLPVAAVGVLAAAAVAIRAPWHQQPQPQAVRFEILPSEQVKFFHGGNPVVSPDGRWIVFRAEGSDHLMRLWIRSLDSVEVRPLPGTETPNKQPIPAFWSPDSRFIAFSDTPTPFSRGQLKKLNVYGGTPETICDIPIDVSGAWGPGDTILLSLNYQPLMRVAASGGVPTPVTVLDAGRHETGHRLAQFLPDGKHFLYYRSSNDPENTANNDNPRYSGVYVGSLDTPPAAQSLTPILLNETQAYYAPPLDGGAGHLLFVRDNTLLAQAFDVKRLTLTGKPVPVADRVGSYLPANVGLFSISQTGVLAYQGGGGTMRLRLTWRDAGGKLIETVGDIGAYRNPALSPDGTRIAVTLLDSEGGTSSLWVFDLSNGNRLRLTSGPGRNDYPVWSPDNRNIAFASNRSGHMDLYLTPADNLEAAQLLLSSAEDKTPTSWSKDGRFLLYTSVSPKTREDLWVLENPSGNSAERMAHPLLQTPFRESEGRISPDGRSVVYLSDESGLDAIYLRKLSPDGISGDRWQISTTGDPTDEARWRGDGRALLIRATHVEAVAEVKADGAPVPGAPRRLFDSLPTITPREVSSDGKRYLYAEAEGPNEPRPFTVVLNWPAVLTK